MMNNEVQDKHVVFLDIPKPTLMQRFRRLFSCCDGDKCDCGHFFCDGKLCYRTSFLQKEPLLKLDEEKKEPTEIDI